MKLRIFTTLALSLVLTGLAASTSLAQGTSTRATTRQTETLLIRIETKIGILKDEAERVAERSSSAEASTDTLVEYLAALDESMVKLHDTFDARDPITDDLTDVLTQATPVDQFLVRNRVTPSAQSQWKSLKRDLNTLATYNRLSWNWNKPIPVLVPAPTTPAYIVSDSQMQTLISRIGLKTGIYKTQMETALRTDDSADLSDEAIAIYISRLETAASRLKQRFDSRQSSGSDASDLLLAATYLDQFMNRNRLTTSAQAQWRNLRGDLNTLATNYRVSWNWNQTLPGNTGANPGGVGLRNFDARITGTYRLNPALSEDPSAAIERALGSTSGTNREDSRANLERRLRSPEMIAIEMKNKTVGMASTILPQVTFQADGVARSETNTRGRITTTTATVDEDGLIINYQGERANDFYLTFFPTSDGRLKVTRRIYLDNSSESVTVSSIYDKMDNVARWANVTANTGDGSVSGVIEDSYVVPTGTRLTAELTAPISGSPVTDRFTMEITSLGQFRRAVISGRVLAEDAASKVAGRTRVLLAFDTIRLSNGKTHRFAGNIDAITAANGDFIQVTNQAAAVRSTTQPTRGAGGILGALIGAISGVPVDQTGTAASTSGAVVVQRGDMMNLGSGSQITITATLPRN